MIGSIDLRGMVEKGLKDLWFFKPL